MLFQITVRYGGRYQRYHTYTVEAADASEAMITGAEEMPDDVAAEADLVEIRTFVDPDARTYVGEDED
jgi:hypothetical protein